MSEKVIAIGSASMAITLSLLFLSFLRTAI